LKKQKDEIWRKSVKMLEEKIINMENEALTLKKNERKLFSRQKFFEKYSQQAEEKFE